MTRKRSLRAIPAVFAGMLLLFAAKFAATQTPGPNQAAVHASPNVPSPQSAAGLFNATAHPQSGPAVQLGAAGDMIGFSHADASGTKTITLVHTSKSWMAVYHIDRSGSIRLVSSRPIDADFSLQLNATSPLPEEIRKMGKSR